VSNANPVRKSINANQAINDAGLALIKQYEQGPGGGPALVAYQDPSGVWTIGWGHTGDVYPDQIIDEEEADSLLESDVITHEDEVNYSISGAPFKTTSNQFSAMVSLCYNIGNYGFLSSSVLKRHLQQNFVSAAANFLLWDKAHINGQLVTVQGLLNRRRAEVGLYNALDTAQLG
jgi:lysozyme